MAHDTLPRLDGAADDGTISRKSLHHSSTEHAMSDRLFAIQSARPCGRVVPEFLAELERSGEIKNETVLPTDVAISRPVQTRGYNKEAVA